MTETTSFQNFTRERHTYAPVVRRPGLATFIAQAAVGSFCGTFAVLLARIVFVYESYNALFVLWLPMLMVLGLVTGAVAGFLIWAAAKEADGPLLGIVRALIGVLIMGMAWFAFWYFLVREQISLEVQLWILAGILVSGVSLGLMTGSRLRVWQELVRAGETTSTLLEVLAGISGFVLRPAVVISLLGMLIFTIAGVQSYFLGPQPLYKSQVTDMVWSLVLLGHFATGAVILFARIRFWSLVPLAVISVSPVVAALWIARLNGPEPNFVIAYLSVWAMFLLTRWRQTDIAWFHLREELRYYLID